MNVPKVSLKDFVYKPDTFGTIRAIGIDKYPGEMPIVRELLQNADDYEGSIVRFRIDSEEIIVENDGKPFSKPEEVGSIEESDFYRISHIGLGKNKEEMTGTFGIGFTSVFHITDTPRVVSNGWDFEIHINDVPSIKSVPFDKITRFHLPLRLKETEISERIKAEAFDLEKLERFEEQLLEEAYRDIFFLKNIGKIEAYKKRTKVFTVYKRIRQTESIAKNLTRRWVTIHIISSDGGRKKRHRENWIIYSLSGLDIPSNLRTLGQELKQKVAIAIPLNPKGTRITKEFDTQKYAYYTLPVMNTGFNFRYNASKLYTTSGRSEFVTKEGLKREWNIWQVHNLAELLSLVIQDLISRKVNTRIIYRFVPISSQVRHPMDEHLFDSFKQKVEANEIKLFYTPQEIWREKDAIYMNWNGLHKVLPSESGTHLIHPRLKKFTSVFLSYGIGKIGLEEFVSYLEKKYGTSSDDSKKSEDPDRIRMIFEYLNNKQIKPHIMDKLRKTCILLTEEGVLRSYEYRVYFPTDEKMPLINKGDILHHGTYNSIASRKFLQKKLKIKKMNLHHLILDSFLPRIGDYNDDRRFEFVWYLIKRQRDVTRKRNTINELRKNIQDIVLLENTNEPGGPFFFADAHLKEIFGDKLNYISSRYEEQGKEENVKWRSFLKKIGVKETPLPNKVNSIVQELESDGYTAKNVKKVQLILRFLHTHWRRFYRKHIQDLQELREYRWIPTDKKIFAYPTEVYVIKTLQRLVGKSQNFLEVKMPKNKRLTKVLGLLTEARIDDVIEFILKKRGEEEGETDKPVSFGVYSFLNRKVDSLSSDHLKTLRENRTMWFRRRLWKPRELYLKDYRNEFGPSGWLRGYIRNDKLSKLHGLCMILGIDRTPRNPDDYLYWLVDAANELENQILENWQIKLVRKAYSKLASVTNVISEEQLAELRQRNVMLTSEARLRPPFECYLLRKGEELIQERILKAGIAVPIVQAEDAEHEKLYLRLGINEIAYSLSAKRADENQASFDEVWTERFHSMLPWLDGFEFSLTGEVSEHNLALKQLKIYRVSKLRVTYSLEGKDGLHKGHPIEDVCCDERDERIIYLDEHFELENNEHLRLLILNLIKNLNPAVEKVGWSLAIPFLLTYGQLMGISPYDREAKKYEKIAVLPPSELAGKGEVAEAMKPPEAFDRKEGPTEIYKYTPEDLRADLNRARAEATLETKEKQMDFSKIYRKKKESPSVKSPSTIKYSIEAKRIASKNWKPKIIDGETVYVEEGIDLPPIDKIRTLRRLTKKIVEVMGFNPETVNICIAKLVTDGYNENGQLFFNAAREDSPYRWFGVVARELANNYSRKHYPHVTAMLYLITKGLENFDEILPEFTFAQQSKLDEVH